MSAMVRRKSRRGSPGARVNPAIASYAVMTAASMAAADFSANVI